MNKVIAWFYLFVLTLSCFPLQSSSPCHAPAWLNSVLFFSSSTSQTLSCNNTVSLSYTFNLGTNCLASLNFFFFRSFKSNGKPWVLKEKKWKPLVLMIYLVNLQIKQERINNQACLLIVFLGRLGMVASETLSFLENTYGFT